MVIDVAEAAELFPSQVEIDLGPFQGNFGSINPENYETAELLWNPRQRISQLWNQEPSEMFLHVYVDAPIRGGPTPGTIGTFFH
jgi:hypothetical protein